MKILLLLPALFQSALLLFDEFYYHRKRELPKWERIGHPLDTLSVLFCLLWLLHSSYSTTNLIIYLFFMLISAIFITKDELIHSKLCSGGEHWIHSLLYILHPVWMATNAWTWYLWQQGNGEIAWILKFQILIIIPFLFYQFLYWNFILNSNRKQSLPVNNDLYEDLGEKWYHAQNHPIALLRSQAKIRDTWVLNHLPSPHSHYKILDIGCGAGFLSNFLAKHGYSVSGIDLSSESLKIAERYDSTQTINYQVGDATQLPFLSESFDAICAMDFLEHVEKPEKVISEISRVLKPKGLFFFHTFNRNTLSWLLAIKAIEWFIQNTPKRLHVRNLFIKPKELDNYCKKNNLSIYKWIGLRPRIFKLATLSLLKTKEVPKNFQFTFTPSLAISYCGIAKKITPELDKSSKRPR